MACPLKPDDVPKDLVCPICFNVPIQPRILNPCSHVFCKDCIEKSLSHRKKCPVCQCSCKKNQVLLLEKYPIAKRIWASILVKCKFDVNGCKWTGCVADYQSHQRSCEDHQRQVRREIFTLKKTIKGLNKQEEDVSRKIDSMRFKITKLNTERKSMKKRRIEAEASKQALLKKLKQRK